MSNVPKAPKTLHVLLVEDDPADAFLIRSMLEEARGTSFAANVAGSLRDALAWLSDNPCQAVVLDLSLPDSRGLATFHQLRQHHPALPVVVLTGLDDESLALQAVSEGAQDFLVKGQVRERRLTQALHHAMGRQRRLLRVEKALEHSQEEERVAREIAKQLLPTTAPEMQGFDLFGHSIPRGASGGDLLDWYKMPSGAWRIAIGDVTGHGLGPSLLMATTRAYLRAYATMGVSIEETLAKTNDALMEDLGDSRNVTLFLAELEPVNRRLTYASAGHVPGLLIDGRGAVRERLFSTGLPLGVIENANYPGEDPLEIEPGDVLILPTDGVLDAVRPGQGHFGVDGVVQAVRQRMAVTAHSIRSESVVEAIFTGVATWTQGKEPADDCTVVALRCLES
jgi:serine phosphatase RsbU (regulator of sigma subunit)